MNLFHLTRIPLRATVVRWLERLCDSDNVGEVLLGILLCHLALALTGSRTELTVLLTVIGLVILAS